MPDEIDLDLGDVPPEISARMRRTRQAVDDKFGPPTAGAIELSAKLLAAWDPMQHSKGDLLDAMAVLTGTVMGDSPAGADGIKLMMIRFASVSAAIAKAVARGER